ncbi:MAG: ester cyclase [Pseudomonadota bacterium]
MKHMILVLAVATMVCAVSSAQATDREVVEDFYTELLSQPNAPDIADRVSKVVVQDWVSIPTPRGGPDAEGLVKSLKGFGAAIPDLNWEIQEILNEGNRYIVRSIATGTPVKTFFGIEPRGKSFEIMTIDIHEVQNGKIVRSYHVEEWATAIRQLSAE